jgi:hypothetical protein
MDYIEYNPLFADAIGGYPKDCRVKSGDRIFISLVDDNLDDPLGDFPTRWELADA